MSEDVFKDRVWVVIGHPSTLSRDDLIAALSARGALVRTKTSTRTEFYVAGDGAPSALSKARLHHAQELNEAQAIALLEDTPLADALAAHATPSAPEAHAHEALSTFRALVHQAPSPEAWCAICEALDTCDPSVVPLALEYLDAHLGRWPASLPSVHACSPQHVPAGGYELRVAPPAWRQAIFRGEDSPKLRIVRTLQAAGEKITGKLIDRMLRCDHLTELRYLDLSANPIPIRAWTKMGASNKLNRLTHINVSDVRFNHKAASAWSHAGGFDALTHIDLSYANVSPSVLANLFLGPTLRHVKHLNLTGAWLIDADDALAWARVTPHLRLEGLTLPRDLGEGALGALIKTPMCDTLHTLVLNSADTSTDEARALVGRGAQAWTAIDWSELEWDDATWGALLRAPQWSSLETLHLHKNRGLGSRAAEALSRAPLNRLRSLRLDRCAFDEADFARILSNPHLTRLEHLDIGHTDADDSAAYAIRDNAALRSLRVLDMSATAIEDAGLRALALDTPHLAALERLDCRHTGIALSGALAVERSPYLTLSKHKASMSWEST